MHTIIHLSDLHFGTERTELTAALIEDIKKIGPEIVIVSGDLTQRARNSQFKSASEFLKKLPGKIMCVPGNHDISLHNPFERFFAPFQKYQKWINPMLCEQQAHGDLVILGINSVTPYKPMGGYVTDEQLKMATDFFAQHPDKIKIVVMHHNLIRSERHKIINDSDKIINVLGQAKVNLILSGHIHLAHIEKIKRESTQLLYVVTAGTPISTRTIAANSFNVIELNKKEFSVTVKVFEDGKYAALDKKVYPLY